MHVHPSQTKVKKQNRHHLRCQSVMRSGGRAVAAHKVMTGKVKHQLLHAGSADSQPSAEASYLVHDQ